jgi:hypothetical protein
VLVALWPLTFHIYIPKWDDLDAYLPYRHAVGEMVLDGKWHFWHPFHYMGSPVYSDLQSGAWNPIVLALAYFFGGYDISALITELLLCYIIAGIGMFKLAKTLFSNNKVAFILGISYALSGCMVNSAQLMVFLLGVAYLPWIFMYIYKLLNTFKWKYIVLLAIAVALHITSASPAYTILLFYFCVLFVIYIFIRRRKSEYNYKKAILRLLTSLFIICLLILPYLNAFYDFAPYFNRIEKMSMEDYLSNPFTPRDYISFLFPFSTISDSEYFVRSTLTLRSGYFGIVGLTFFIYAIIKLKKIKIRVMLAAVLVSLYLAWGYHVALYELLMKLPGFGTFRHPSIYRTYTIFFGLLLAGFGLVHLIKSNRLNSMVTKSAYFWLIFGVCTIVISFFFTSWDNIGSSLEGVINYIENSEQSIATLIFVNGLVLILGILIAFFLRKFFKVSILTALIIFCVFDIVINTQLTGPRTIYNTFSKADVQDYFDNLPSDIDQSFNETPLKNLDHKLGIPYAPGLWLNLSIFYKRPSYNGVNPLRFKNEVKAAQEGDLQFITEDPLFQVPLRTRKEIDTVQGGLIWDVEENYSISNNQKMKLSKPLIEYNKFKVDVNNSTDQHQYLILNQNYHHLWNAKFNNRGLEIQKVNTMVMAVKIPANSAGQVEYEYVSKWIPWTTLIALIGYLLCIGFLIYQNVTTTIPKSSDASSHKE